MLTPSGCVGHVHRQQDMKLSKREKRNTSSGSFDDKVYIDNIGVPGEVPDESKQEIRS